MSSNTQKKKTLSNPQISPTHFSQNILIENELINYKKDRSMYSGAFLDTLVNPLFIVRQKYRPKVSLQGKSLQRSNNSLDSKMQNKSRIQI